VLFNKSRHAGYLAALGVATSRGVAGLGRFVPLLGGVVGGGFDAALTHMIGRTAHRVFLAHRDIDEAAPEDVAAPAALALEPPLAASS
jgi:hypothetical protein